MSFRTLHRHGNERSAELNASFPNIHLTAQIMRRRAHAARRLTHGCDVVCIATETADEAFNPVEGDSLIVQAVVCGH